MHDDGARLVKTGQFGVDMDKYREKTRAERRLVWKHRAGVLWREFGSFVVVPAKALGWLAYGAAVVYATWKVVGRHTTDIQDHIGFTAIATIVLITVHGVIFAYRDEICVELCFRYRNVVEGWNPPTLKRGRDDA